MTTTTNDTADQVTRIGVVVFQALCLIEVWWEKAYSPTGVLACLGSLMWRISRIQVPYAPDLHHRPPIWQEIPTSIASGRKELWYYKMTHFSWICTSVSPHCSLPSQMRTLHQCFLLIPSTAQHGPGRWAPGTQYPPRKRYKTTLFPAMPSQFLITWHVHNAVSDHRL